MILAMRIILTIFIAFFCLASIASNTESRGYMCLAGAATVGALLLLSYRIM